MKMARGAALAALWLAAGVCRLAADLADDLARVGVEAAGGAAAHAALHGVRAAGVTRVGEREVGFILHAERPDRMRIETLGERGSLVRASDGVHAPWKKADLLQPPQRLARAEERDFLLDADFDSPLYDYARRRISLDYAGEAEADGRPCQKLLATLRFTEVVTLYLDDETHLVVRRDLAKKVKGRDVVIETHYSDFRPLRGVLLPRRIRTVVAGVVLNDTMIREMEANPELPPGFFAPPTPGWPKK